MKTYQKIRENPWKRICSEEWKRAKGIINYNRPRPRFYWSKAISGRTHAHCSSTGQEISLRASIRDLDPTKPEVEKSVRELIRHEIAHIGTTHHGSDFMVNLERLSGSRYSSIPLPARKRAQKERYTASWPTGETSTYWWSERQMKKMVKKYGFINVEKIAEIN